jgi:hypothetical protein
MATPVDTAKEW